MPWYRSARVAGSRKARHDTVRLEPRTKRLRIVFGDPLLRRGPHGMEPTERALHLREPVKAVLAEIQSIVSTRLFRPGNDAANLQALDERRHERRGVAFDRAQPAQDGAQYRLLVTTSGPREACVRILNDEVELAIGVFPYVPAEIMRRELYRECWCAWPTRTIRDCSAVAWTRRLSGLAQVTVAPNLDSGVQLDDISQPWGYAAGRRDGPPLHGTAWARPRNRPCRPYRRRLIACSGPRPIWSYFRSRRHFGYRSCLRANLASALRARCGSSMDARSHSKRSAASAACKGGTRLSSRRWPRRASWRSRPTHPAFPSRPPAASWARRFCAG